jgi:NAD(P)H-hydrate epimerase
MTGYLNAADAAALDVELMSTPGFSLEQLMELAGLAVAEAVYQVIPPPSSSTVTTTTTTRPRILLICGPGNNGGDGLVAARHLVLFGYDCIVVYPKRSSQTHFINLVKQCEDVNVQIFDEIPPDLLLEEGEEGDAPKYNAIVDAIFGFSFKGEPREPFRTIIHQMMQAQTERNIPVISVDVPSGWNVDEGDVAHTGFVPQVLISLTTPKHSSKGFPGRHFVGGRFLPPALSEKYNVQVRAGPCNTFATRGHCNEHDMSSLTSFLYTYTQMPPYPGVSQVMEVTHLTKPQQQGESSSWEQEYAEYLAGKHADEQVVLSSSATTTASAKNEGEKKESWEHQYAAHCVEEEARLAKEDARRIQELKEEQ